ncbi:hypothetical protein FA15DRAFT_697360 [Coprinopsis marcescibilis]|uniref:Uncharacterized protein n=1 Tax=Coprinopsis marcescibilis TaxID=230819 RepID=A0A5C3KI61_COPMA|nr:hypothetical protein FA15DRAFT_697360 [Coprinopsis marcescibilis]
MAPQTLSLLFVTKKKPVPKPKPKLKPPAAGAVPTISSASTAAAPPTEAKTTVTDFTDPEDRLKLPNSQYIEYPLLSSIHHGWKYNMMRFETRSKPIEILKWTEPVKLNRKDLLGAARLRANAAAANVPRAVKLMLGPDGEPVIGPDGNQVMVDADGRPIVKTIAGDKQKQKKKLQKKPRQVFTVPEKVLHLRQDERYPWVLEDSNPQLPEHWISQLDSDSTKSQTCAVLMPHAGETFKVVLTHRWYKFQKKINHNLPTNSKEMEAEFAKSQKKEYLANQAALAMLKQEEAVDDNGICGPGWRTLRTVSRTNFYQDWKDEDDDFGNVRRTQARMGQDAGHDEDVFEEDFADDDEGQAPHEDDEEGKEDEDRLKRRYRQHNKQRETGVDESDEEEEDAPQVNGYTNKIQKMIFNREGNSSYDTDEESNPYLSDGEISEEEVLEEVLTGPAVQVQPQQRGLKPTAANGPSSSIPAGASSSTPVVSNPEKLKVGGDVQSFGDGPKRMKLEIGPSDDLKAMGRKGPGDRAGTAPQVRYIDRAKRNAEDGIGGDARKKIKIDEGGGTGRTGKRA